jgi:hypothetical protein
MHACITRYNALVLQDKPDNDLDDSVDGTGFHIRRRFALRQGLEAVVENNHCGLGHLRHALQTTHPLLRASTPNHSTSQSTPPPTEIVCAKNASRPARTTTVSKTTNACFRQSEH